MRFELEHKVGFWGGRWFQSQYVFSVAFSPYGRTALSGATDETLKLWDLAAAH
jgi:WD40 repeat protein